jgi:hypothetical protein
MELVNHIYTASQFWEAADIPVSTYHQWRARGFIRSVYKTEGSGRPQMYDFSEVFRGAVLSRLVSFGLPVSLAAECLDSHNRAVSILAGQECVSTLHGFKSSAAYLILYQLPGSLPPALGREIITESELQQTVLKHEGAVVVALDKIEVRVKRVLGVKS